VAILVTGAAGFIGFHVTQALIKRGDRVIGLDNLNDYYEPELKEDRLGEIKASDANGLFEFRKVDLAVADELAESIKGCDFTSVVHLAAQAGVRYSIENPGAYISSNISGFMNMLEVCREAEVEHLVYASSSSVYGNNEKVPYSTEDSVDHPISMYAATKKSNELMAHVYSHLHGIPTTGLRFFSVYGPWGRPDMSPFIFADAILNDRIIRLFNEGRHKRDFTYIDDVVDGVVRVLDQPAVPDSDSEAPYRIYNIGNNEPVDLLDYVHLFEKAIGKKAKIEMAPLQPGDVETTFADIENIKADFGFHPKTSLKEGIEKFVTWYKDYYPTS